MSIERIPHGTDTTGYSANRPGHQGKPQLTPHLSLKNGNRTQAQAAAFALPAPAVPKWD